MSTVKVGDVVAWDKVPDGALVRWLWDGHGHEYFYRRHGHCVSRVGSYDGVWARQGRDDGSFAPSEAVTIVALGLTGQESASDLRRLAEVFEVREALRADDQLSLLMEADGVVRIDHIEDEQTQAERLHAAGWRPGMTAEDAARLLAQAGGAS